MRFLEEKAFTMIEVMVVTAIIGILSLPLMTLVNQVTTSLIEHGAGFDKNVELRIAAQQIKQDLQSLVRPEQFLHANSDSIALTRYDFVSEGEGGGSNFEFGNTTDQGNCEASDGLSTYVSELGALEVSGDTQPASERRSLAFHIGEAGTGLEHCVLRRRVRSHTRDQASSGYLFPPLDNNYQSMSGRNSGNNIDRLFFRFYDGNAWQNSWDFSQQGELPVTVEFTLRAYDPTGQTEPIWYRDAANIKTSGN